MRHPRPALRLFAIALAGLAALGAAPAALAEAAKAPLPADLQPVPEPPPPPAGYEPDASTEPQVTIKQRGEDKVEEYRVNNQLYMIKVTPPHGTPYYLVDYSGKGIFTREDSISRVLHVPMWVIKTF